MLKDYSQVLNAIDARNRAVKAANEASKRLKGCLSDNLNLSGLDRVKSHSISFTRDGKIVFSFDTFLVNCKRRITLDTPPKEDSVFIPVEPLEIIAAAQQRQSAHIDNGARWVDNASEHDKTK